MPEADSDDEAVNPAIIGVVAAVIVVLGVVLYFLVCRSRQSPESEAPAFGDRVRVGVRSGIVCEGPDQDGIYRIAYDDDGTLSDYLDASEIQKSGEGRRPSDLKRASQLLKRFTDQVTPQRNKTQAELELSLFAHGGSSSRASFSARNVAKSMASRPADPMMPSHWGAMAPPQSAVGAEAPNGEPTGEAKAASWTPDDVFRDGGLALAVAAAAANPAPSALAASQNGAFGAAKEKRAMHVKFRLNKLTSMCQWEAIDFDSMEEADKADSKA